MHIAVLDGEAIFASYLIKATIDDSIKKDKLRSFSVSDEGIIIFPFDDILQAEWVLREYNIPYTIEPISYKDELKEKAKGLKYASRTEALQHLIEDIEPEGHMILNLKKKLEEKDQELKTLKEEFKSLKNVLKIHGMNI